MARVFLRFGILPIFFVAAGSFAVARADDRLPVPGAEEQAKAAALVKDLFKVEYASQTPVARSALSAKLLQQADDSKDDPTGRYVLLRESRDVAAKAGDSATCMKAAEDMAATFRVSAGEASSAAADALAAAVTTPAAARAATEALQSAADSATAAGELPAAVKLLKAAAAAARKSENSALLGASRARVAQAESLQAEAAKLKDQYAALKTNPDDPAANLAVGKFLCLAKHDWEKGVPFLAKCADARLKDAAAKDAAAATGSEVEQIAAADAWYDLAGLTNADAKVALQIRAYHWYGLALPRVTGLSKAKAQKRVEELRPVAEARADKSKFWAELRRAVAADELKRWNLVGGGFAHLTFEEIPPDGAILIGFRYTTKGDGNYPAVIQPIYRTARGEINGKVYGIAERNAVPQLTKAKPGYAVGAIYVRGGGGFDAFKPIYMRMKDKGLDTTDAYDGPQVGGKGGGEGTLGGDGNFIVGLHGKVDKDGKMETMSPVSITPQSAADANPNLKAPAPR